MNICKNCGSSTTNKSFCCMKCRSEYIIRSNRIIVRCESCGKEFETIKRKPNRFCSTECRIKYQRSDECINKRLKTYKNTVQKKYGVDHYSKTDEYKIKVNQTKLNIYGNENYNNREKFKGTMLDRYDGIGFQVDNISSAAQIGLINKYGVPTSLFDPNVKNKIKKTMNRLYGTDYYWGSDAQRIKQHIKKINKIKPVLDKLEIELLDEYIGTKTSNYTYYNFKCHKCNNTFESHFANGHIPICPICNPPNKYVSNIENEVAEFISTLGLGQIFRNTRRIIDRELDIYIPSKKIAIEINGNFWHSELAGHKDKYYHVHKTEQCEKLGIQLVHIFEDEWKYKQDIVKRRLIHIIGLDTERIYARKCKIINVDSKDAKKFINTYHIQGFYRAPIRIGLLYNNELISIMTFGKSRIALGNTSDCYELIRYVSSKTVVGGASKLFKYFIRNYNPNKIISYADRRWSQGKIYDILGFKKVSNGTPNYWYVHKSNYLFRNHRFNFRKNVLNNKLQVFDNNLTEWQNMQLNNYDRIWDCGSIKYVYQGVDSN